MKTRTIALISICIIFCPLLIFGQVKTIASSEEISNSSKDAMEADNSRDLYIGAGAGQTKLYAQLPLSSPQNVYFLYCEKNEGSGFSYGATASSGGLESTYPLYNLGSYNQFIAFDVHLSFTLSAFITGLNKNYTAYHNVITDFTDNLYLSIGIGAINNNITRIKTLDSLTINPDSGEPVIKRQSIVPYLPFKVGYGLYITKRLVLDAAFQYTWCLGNYVDGYNMPFSGHKHTAVYTIASIGIKYAIIHNRPHKQKTE